MARVLLLVLVVGTVLLVAGAMVPSPAGAIVAVTGAVLLGAGGVVVFRLAGRSSSPSFSPRDHRRDDR